MTDSRHDIGAPRGPRPKRYGANLGLATTEDLLREVIARFAITAVPPQTEKALVLAEMIGNLSAADREYRTVNEDV